MEDDREKSANNIRPEGERRQFPRMATSVDVEYKVLTKQKLHRKKTITKNISSGGICLIVYEKIEPGTELELKIHIADIHYIVEAKGRVIWNEYFTIEADGKDRYDLGIEFVKIEPVDRQKIDQFVFRLT